MPAPSASNSDIRLEAIHVAIRAVPAGEVAGYGEIARRAGLPGRARLVARVLAQNDDEQLPWHRILRSDGRIAFPPDSPMHAEQVQRLRAEGVRVEQGRVRGQRAAPTLDEILWAPPPGASGAQAKVKAGGRRDGGPAWSSSALDESLATPRIRPRR